MDEETKHLLAVREERRQGSIRANKRDAAPVLAELTEAGYMIDAVEYLYINKLNYKSAIPILLKWLPLIDNLAVKEAIVRALTVPWAKPIAAPALLAEYHKLENESDIGIKWAIANALEVVADDNSYDQIVNFVQDPRNGSSRQMLTLALGNMKNPHAQNVLLALLDDDQVAGHAIIALGKLRSIKAYDAIEKFTNHPRTWVRKEAKRALTRIEKVKTK
ncbi:MAG: HEAT repeat domain-containing protein [Anaerolineaceae bacterium]|jgi:hypothetical protein